MSIVEELRSKASRDNRELLDRAAVEIEDLERNLEAAYKKVEELQKELEAKKSEWISVEERLPEPNEKCLIAAKWGDRVVMDLGELVPSFDIITKEESYDWLITYDWDEGEGFEITHWMPLPEAPKNQN